MKLFLISINQQDVEEYKIAPTDISSSGVRYLSSYLKSKGHEVSILFLPKPYGIMESGNEINQIIELIKKSQPSLIGISLMSNHFFRAAALTKEIKKRISSVPVIWGGIHPTIKPRECLDFSDMVCVGEGELAMEKLMDNLEGYKDLGLEGIWYKNGNEIVEAGVAPLIRDLDNLPYPDYDLDDHYILHQGKLIPLSVEILKQYYPASVGDHRLISSRGCPHACAYCCNSVFRDLYSGGYLRRRSVGNLISEMAEIKNKFPFIKSFKIMDDSFGVNTNEWMREFNREYKQKISLPFFCLVSPSTINEEKLDLLVDAGLKTIQIGLQSGSDRVNSQIYLRSATANDFLKAMKLFEKYQGRLYILVDVIVDNPYEEEGDIIETIKILNQIKRPFHLSIFSLAFYPGTSLYKRATADKILNDENEYLNKQFHLLKHNLLNKIIYLIPYLPKQKINQFINNRWRVLTRLYIGALYLTYVKKNKLPPIVLKMSSKVFKN